ncbi:hypothetical protein C6B38_07555 [Spiroplasma sp. ChiS]|uniref:hypothetical protein n=1 Tax=Spiroplasma sp. ChiS TaxID=2099885 RepID=UPI000CF8AF0C|nr:hypothetical protein [Spiroplasma sp. ChiS]PQP78189.1 hypothetical protein C6B38_07555 [Spiroplasma sp. ChiS]
MAGQIFERSGWVKKNNIKIWKKLHELKLSRVILKDFKTFDEKDILIKNFIYLLRLNNLDEQEYFDSIILIKLVLIYYHMQYIRHSGVKREQEQILKVIKELKNKIFVNYLGNNYEEAIFADIDITNSKIKIYYNFNLLYNFIANVFYQPFINLPNHELYFNYGYYLVFLINLTVMRKLLKDSSNVEIYKIKLDVTAHCHYLIGKITPLYFNNFVQQINYFLQKY